MKKSTIILTVLVGLIIVAGLSLGVYFYLTKEDGKKVEVVERSSEEKELDEVKTDLEKADDYDLTEVDSEVSELEKIDLSGV